MRNDQKIEVQEISYHRNGIAGEGFYAVRFRWETDRGMENFIGTVFDGRGQCAVLSLDRIAANGVAFGVNSWRGDTVEAALRVAIEGKAREATK
jgi:hypothetical protein